MDLSRPVQSGPVGPTRHSACPAPLIKRGEKGKTPPVATGFDDTRMITIIMGGLHGRTSSIFLVQHEWAIVWSVLRIESPLSERTSINEVSFSVETLEKLSQNHVSD